MTKLTVLDQDMENNIARTVDGMAHWAGTGPSGRVCGECEHFVEVSRGLGKSTRCQKYKEMMNGKWASKKLPETTPSCKYYEERR